MCVCVCVWGGGGGGVVGGEEKRREGTRKEGVGLGQWECNMDILIKRKQYLP